MSQSKLDLNHPARVEKIIAHRKMREASMASPAPKISVSGKAFQLNQIPYINRLLMASTGAGREVLWVKGAKHFQTLRKDPTFKPLEKIFVLTIIDEPYIESKLSIGDFTAPKNFLVATADNEVCTFKITGLPDDDATMELFGVGTKIHLFQSRSLIYWIDEDETAMENFSFIADARSGGIYPMGKVNNACRYCLKENAENKCSSCKVPYCSRKCQVADWKIMKHKRVCKATVGTSEPQSNAISSEMKTDGIASISKPNDLEKVQTTTSGLKNPDRISRIRSFRTKYQFFFKSLVDCDFEYLQPIVVRVAEMNIPPNPKLIVLKEMKCDSFYWEKAIELTIIDELLVGLSDYVYLLVEDKNKDITIVAIKGLFRQSDECQRFQVGTRVLVVHPFYKVGTGDGLPFIRVEHLATVKIVGMKRKICRYCGKENAARMCRKCGRMYCGESCETMDSQINHASICETGPMSLNTLCYINRSRLIHIN